MPVGVFLANLGKILPVKAKFVQIFTTNVQFFTFSKKKKNSAKLKLSTKVDPF